MTFPLVTSQPASISTPSVASFAGARIVSINEPSIGAPLPPHVVSRLISERVGK